jgi:hypothetical protein
MSYSKKSDVPEKQVVLGQVLLTSHEIALHVNCRGMNPNAVL